MRDSRSQRSMIRMFWVYQDEIGVNDIKTFQRPANKTFGMKLKKKKIKADEKIKTYGNKFIERDNAVTFCESLKPAFEKVAYQVDAYKMEDLQFDLLIGKVTADEALNKIQDMAEDELHRKADNQLNLIIEHPNQSVQTDGHIIRYLHDGLRKPKPKRPEPIHKPPVELNDSSANNEKVPAKPKKPVKKPNQPADKISQQPQPVKP